MLHVSLPLTSFQKFQRIRFSLQEHLLIVCELLKANLYEFQKFNRESGGEVYFTMPRLQVSSKSILHIQYSIFNF